MQHYSMLNIRGDAIHSVEGGTILLDGDTFAACRICHNSLKGCLVDLTVGVDC